MTETRVLHVLTSGNKPFNCQGVADMVAQFGIKKVAVQRTLDDLVASGRIGCKEFGKSKLYIPLQQGAQILSKEEMDLKQEELKRLEEEGRERQAQLKQSSQKLAEIQNRLSLDDIRQKLPQLQAEAEALEGKLAPLRSGAVAVTAEQRARGQEQLGQSLQAWRKRKSIFKELWATVSENMEGKQADLFELMGVETDEAAGDDLAQLSQLMPKTKRLR